MIGLVDGNNFFVSCERVFDCSLEGKPVAVLSNNDGCVVSRSNEFKKLGIAMGTPYFQLKPKIARLGLVLRSGNHELYSDMSNRLMQVLGALFADIEQYSVDEAFVYPADGIDFFGYGLHARATILKWIGIPCGIGFAPTKTLAKIANHIAKKTADGVFVLPEDPSEILSQIPVGEVWGVGRRLAPKLERDRILTARDLAETPEGKLSKKYGVMLVRTALELRGVACKDESHSDDNGLSQSLTCSRCFGSPVRDFESLSQSVAYYLGRAAEKLRAQGQRAAGANVYFVYYPEYSPKKLDGGVSAENIMFPHPTDDTSEMVKAVFPYLRNMYIKGRRYKKSGVMLWGLESGAVQGDFFAPSQAHSRLFSSIDAVNRKFGRGTVFSLAEGLDKKWKMRSDLLSGAYTTSWDDIIVAK